MTYLYPRFIIKSVSACKFAMFFRFFRPPPPEAFRLFLLLLDLLAAAILVTDVLEHDSAIVRVRCREEWERNAWQLVGANVTTASANDVVLRIVSPVSWLARAIATLM